LQQGVLAAAYASARVLAFPSRGDAWGLVANEAVLCGTPVLASPHATAAIELIQRYGVGRVQPLDVNAWCDALLDMVASPERWRTFSARRLEAVASFGVARSVAALQQAINLGRAKPSSAKHSSTI
jgi:glycosyltransferase involved in cell wall biosynthesis